MNIATASGLVNGAISNQRSLPHYFGPADSRFAVLNWPTGPIRGAALICPPLGYEAVTSYQSLRLLAEQLAAAGILCVRIDYPGLGNSLGSAHDANLVMSWSQTIEAAVAEIHGWGIDTIVFVGVRFGANLALPAVLHETGPKLLVAWDPVRSGRRYSRAMKLMAAASSTSDPDSDSIAVAGIEFTDDTLKQLARFDFDASAISFPTLVVTRPDLPDDSWPDGLAELEVVELPGTAEMLDVDAEDSVVPRPILAHIVDWISRRQLDPPAPPRPAPVLATETTEFVGGARLTHRLVRIGGHGLFGVQTTREGNDGAKAVLMLNNGVAPNIGPGRQWIEWGPDWTSAGYTVLRIDMSGLGDSPARDPREEQIVYSRAVDLDLADAVAYLRTAGATHVVTVGLCSGAVFGLRALGAGVGIDAVVAINPGLHSPVAYYRTDLRRGYYRTPVRIAAFPLSKTPLFGLFERIPTWIWRVLDHLRLVRSPVRLPLNAARAGVPALIIFGQKEWALRALRRRDPKGAAALVNSSTVTVTVIEGLDHSMFAVTARDDVRALVREWTDKVMQ